MEALAISNIFVFMFSFNARLFFMLLTKDLYRRISAKEWS